MNNLTKIILSVDRTTILISCSDKSKFKILRHVGAKRKLLSSYKWILTYDSKNELAKQFEFLRDHVFLFAGGVSGWLPSSIFLELKNEGYINGSGIEIIWKNSNMPITRKIQ